MLRVPAFWAAMARAGYKTGRALDERIGAPPGFVAALCRGYVPSDVIKRAVAEALGSDPRTIWAG
jgi:hypothetical protein